MPGDLRGGDDVGQLRVFGAVRTMCVHVDTNDAKEVNEHGSDEHEGG